MANGTLEGTLDSVSTHVTEAFERLTLLQEELRARSRAVTERERTCEELSHALDELAKGLEARESALREAEAQLSSRCTDVERQNAEASHRHRERESRTDEREARLARREEVVGAFQEMLAQMHTALEDLAPESIMAALDAGSAYEDCAVESKSASVPRAAVDSTRETKDPIGLTAEEQSRFFALRDTGKSDAEILADIYEARAAVHNGAAA